MTTPQFWRRIHKGLKEPQNILPYFILRLRQWMHVKKRVIDGQVYFEYQGQTYPAYLNTGNAMSYIQAEAQKYCQGTGLDIGADVWPFPGAIAVRNEKQVNAFKLDRFADASMDYVFSSHCLEHLVDWQGALKLWLTKIKPGGVLFLYLPHESMTLWRKGGPWVGDGHKWIPTYPVINPFLENEGCKIEAFNPSFDKYWSFHIVARKPS